MGFVKDCNKYDKNLDSFIKSISEIEDHKMYLIRAVFQKEGDGIVIHEFELIN